MSKRIKLIRDMEAEKKYCECDYPLVRTGIDAEYCGICGYDFESSHECLDPNI